MQDPLSSALELLERHFGFSRFRPLQGAIVRSVLSRRDTLGVLPTGGGKSLCFQIPALVLGGCTIVVSPLIALMQDQVAAARRRGLRAASLAGSLSPAAVGEILDGAAAGGVNLLYTSPERLPSVAEALRSRRIVVSLMAIDEAHCISEWGHDFRPAFRTISRARALLGNPLTLAVTGSATAAVRDDIVRVLGLGTSRRPVALHVASFDRPNLCFAVRRVPQRARRFEALLAALANRDLRGIVYAPTRRSTEIVAAALRRAGWRARAYHAGLEEGDRSVRLERFLANEIGVVVATSAFGMGIDKPDVRTVVHWSLPATPESYYQEAGRAGRDGRPADCVLLYQRGDADIHRRQLEVTFPPRQLLEAIWSGRLALARVPLAVRASADRLRLELGASPSRSAWARVDGRRRTALDRIDAVEAYARGRGCRRRALLAWFGERGGLCGGCGACVGGSRE